MSGHSKWSTIKRKKGVADQKRSKIFSRIIKEISVAVREGGPDPDGNPRLRMALNNAHGANMPKDNIQRALSKAKDTEALSEITYEGYAPNGIAVFMECLTDNPQRSLGNIRAIFNKRGGSLGTNGSVAFMFDRKGIIRVPKGSFDAEELQLEIIDAGVEDFEELDDVFVITTPLEGFAPVQKRLEELGLEIENAELQRIPVETKTLDPESGVKALKIIELIEDDDDVQNVFHNLEITDEIIEKMNN
ncbi:MAG: YebC/PmpR family DNA-binding transcriptional regulator [Bacteroidales bacterium]|jgi:YebC/PmpR family DNA-binding regulatory protein|nr:YebC/PmpR family DNA-binding transcriptional regulator [Bacteroidales bacterium]